MDRGRLWKLRIFELSYIIAACLILFVLFAVVLWYYHSSVVVLRMIFIFGLLFAIKDVTPAYDWSVHRLIPWLKELKEYELGRSKRNLRRQAAKKTLIIIYGVLIVIAFLFPLEQDPRHMTLFMGDWLSIMCWLLVMVTVHWFVNKINVDAEEGNKRTEYKWLIYILGCSSILLPMYFRNSFEALVIRFWS